MTRDARRRRVGKTLRPSLGEWPLPLKDTNSQGAFLSILPGASCPGITGLLPVSVHRCNVIFLSRRVLHSLFYRQVKSIWCVRNRAGIMRISGPLSKEGRARLCYVAGRQGLAAWRAAHRQVSQHKREADSAYRQAKNATGRTKRNA